jgi:hypothetical protein
MSRDQEPARLRNGEPSTEPIELNQQSQEAEHRHWSPDPDPAKVIDGDQTTNHYPDTDCIYSGLPNRSHGMRDTRPNPFRQLRFQRRPYNPYDHRVN